MRGALGIIINRKKTRGIIPACAGSTDDRHRRRHRLWDYPRMCGKHQCTVFSKCPQEGSSPHVRGARTSCITRQRRRGIIPACAGNTLGNLGSADFLRDHPRMCGEHWKEGGATGQQVGSSPHVRGAWVARPSPDSGPGIIPACAGSMDARCCAGSQGRDHPRMCGEYVPYCAMAVSYWGSSPHVRGAFEDVEHQPDVGGIIPACAGSIRTACF